MQPHYYRTERLCINNRKRLFGHRSLKCSFRLTQKPLIAGMLTAPLICGVVAPLGHVVQHLE
jgi:hypothetical protein